MVEFPVNKIAAFEKIYQELFSKGRKQNSETKPGYAKKDEKTHLNRMEKYRQNHLLFLLEFAVPFGNNMSDKDLRKAKPPKNGKGIPQG
ncbi:hypothetical protein [Clostridium sp. 1001271B_150615_H5]|uniref:hypothetical protein n=1 Tax=Clostridium sp. 1001271B_150615_H5 TaxID=2787105 RepID=UPI0014867717|nr:hypothetical protein [Clostridium sp. 1001271B_150615_H5]